VDLSARDQRLLDQAREDVARSDPRLASMLATFARLTADEAMPDREQLSAPGGPGGRAGRVRRRAGRVRHAVAAAMTRLITWLDRMDSPQSKPGQPGQPGQRAQEQGSR
jgi:hypothetical protein